MNNASSPSFANAILELAQQAGGKPFPDTAVDDLGGWGRIALDAATIAGEPVLPLVAFLVARDAKPGDAAAASAATAIVEAVIATRQPALFRDSLDALLGSAVVIQAASLRLVSGLESVATSFLNREDTDPVADLASADALEAMTRLVAAGHGPHFPLLALLQKFTVPTVAPMSLAVIRSVSIALDVWPEADSLVNVVRALGGVDSVDGADPELAADVEADAAWVLAMASLLRSLRAASVLAMGPHLEDAASFFAVAASAHDRPDAAPMLSIVEALRELAAGIVSGEAMRVVGTEPLSGEALIGIQDQILRFSVDSSGLDHWYGDNKRAALIAWSGLADDLHRMSGQLRKDGFYQAEVVVRDLLDIYINTRTFRVGTRYADICGVQDLIQPVIEEGFARNASHLSNLEEYVRVLESRDADEYFELAEAQLQAATSILGTARRRATGAEALGKVGGGARLVPLPPLLRRLVPHDSPDQDLIAQISPAVLAALEERLDHVAAGRSHLNLVQQELYDEMRDALSTSPDYKGEVVPAVDQILLLIINFVASRTGSSAGHYGYLFDSKAKESAIHEDLYSYLVGNLGSHTEYEAPHVGGGRVDIRLKFESFAVHLEMKVDYTKLPMSDRTAYLKQAATYQGNDIRIGFLVALRHKAFDPNGPPPHIKSLVGHTLFDVVGDVLPRHIIHVAVPGSRISPSQSK